MHNLTKLSVFRRKSRKNGSIGFLGITPKNRIYRNIKGLKIIVISMIGTHFFDT
jgi:hypothetical protein